jgi:hypothetical protein
LKQCQMSRNLESRYLVERQNVGELKLSSRLLNKLIPWSTVRVENAHSNWFISLSRSVKNKIHITVILHVVLYEC